LIPYFPSHSKGIWSEGEICGPGRYTWADGSSYFGEWQDGVPSGVGVWSRSPKDIVKWNGVFDKGIALNLQYEVL
jgi:MORN repeat